MKKITTNNGRRLCSIILTLLIVFGTVTNSIAAWEEMKQSKNVYLNEIWVGQKQCINFYENGEWLRNIAGEGHILWINGNIILYNLYATGYWCYDQYGNCFAINTDSKVMLCKRGSTTFLVDNSITGCTGFIRDGNKIGLMLETNHGNYKLSDLLNGTIGNTHYGTTTTVPSSAPYSYDDIVTQKDSYYYYNYKGREYEYYKFGSSMYCDGKIISQDIEKYGFSYGYFIYVVNTKPSVVYRLPIGKTSEAKEIGRKFESFIYDSSGWIVSVQLEGKTVIVNSNYSNSSNNSSNNNYNYNYGYDYPYVQVLGDYYYYYIGKSKYFQLYFNGTILYYQGTNDIRSDILISSSVDEITFDNNGYIVYSLLSGDVYKLELGKTASSDRKMIGRKFSYFDGQNHISQGYYDTSGKYKDFDQSRYVYDVYPYVENSGDYYYYYKNKNKTYEYYLDRYTLYYDDEILATSVKEVTFSDKGYIIYATTSGYVYSYPVGKTSSSYRKYIGKYFDYFDDDDYMSDGYYDKYDNHVDFDF